jgi:hypothetical protein
MKLTGRRTHELEMVFIAMPAFVWSTSTAIEDLARSMRDVIPCILVIGGVRSISWFWRWHFQGSVIVGAFERFIKIRREVVLTVCTINRNCTEECNKGVFLIS